MLFFNIKSTGQLHELLLIDKSTHVLVLHSFVKQMLYNNQLLPLQPMASGILRLPYGTICPTTCITAVIATFIDVISSRLTFEFFYSPMSPRLQFVPTDSYMRRIIVTNLPAYFEVLKFTKVTGMGRVWINNSVIQQIKGDFLILCLLMTNI